MSPSNQESVFVRIIELPAVRMARSGASDLAMFDKWWSALDAQDKHKFRPKDFMWWNPELNCDEWLYAVPEGLTDTRGYEVFDFPGGLYAVTACKDDNAEIERTFKLIQAWIADSAVFEESTATNDPQIRYAMGHVITPKNAKETLGYHQLDLFVPIVDRRRSS